MKHRKLAAVALAALALSFCRLSDKAREKIAEKAIERSTGKKVDIDKDGQKVVIKGADGQATYVAGALPENFPKDVPVYPGATAAGGFGATSTTGQGESTIVSLQSSDGADKVLAWYQAELPGAGWKIETTVANGAEGGLVAASKEDRMLNVTVGKTDQGAAIAIVTGKK